MIRHAVHYAVHSLVLKNVLFPYSTLFINISGSVLMGVCVGWLALRSQTRWGSDVRLFLTTGVLGGYTTFSTFSLETVLLLERGTYGQAFVYVAGALIGSVGGLYAALLLLRSA